MKKLLILLLIGIMLVGCSDESANEEKESDKNNTAETEAAEDTEQEAEKKDVYQIGETAVIRSDMYEFDYEVTVNDFELTREVEGVSIEDFISGARDKQRFAVVDVTIKNITDETYIPNEMFSANFSTIDRESGKMSEDKFFTERDEELAPGEEITGPVVFVTTVDKSDTFLLKYEFLSDEETHFELPNPEK